MRKTICCLLSTLLLGTMLSGCGGSQKQAAFLKELTDDSYSTGLKQQDGYAVVASGKRLTLSVNGKTADFYLTDLSTGKRWYSGASQKNMNARFRAQIQLTFANSASQISSLNSYSDAVELQQYRWEQCKNGIKVIYDIGKRQKQFLIPTVITKTRMEKAILSKVDTVAQEAIKGMYTLNSLKEVASDVVKDELIKKYPKIKDDDVYVLFDGLADFARVKLEKQIIASGYTQEDLASDNKENQIEETNTSISFRIPVEYTIENDSFMAKVKMSEVGLPSNAHLLSLDLLPYFGSAGEEESGYMMVPDGSGALINLNNGKSSQGIYQMPLYGSDIVMPNSDPITTYQNCSLPVYGMKQSGGGFVAVLEDGAALASIQAGVNDGSNHLNYIYPSFSVYQSQKADVPYNQATSMYFYQKNVSTTDFTLRYFFLDQKQNDYSGMAQRYQHYLKDKGALTEKTTAQQPFYLSMIGAVNKQENILGIPANKIIPLTTFSQAEQIVKELQNKGVKNIVAEYRGWCNGGLKHSAMNKVKVQKQLGGIKDLQAFQSFMEESGNRLYWDADIQNVYQTAMFDQFSSLFDSPKNIMGETATALTYNRLSGEALFGTNLISPSKYMNVAKNMRKSWPDSIHFNISLNDLGSQLYSDFDSNKFTDRQTAASQAEKVFAYLGKSGKILGQNPSEYVLQYLTEAVGIPMNSNGHYLFDREIPFYQMVLHGYLSYAGTPINYCNNITDETLHLIETGTMPYFEWMYQENNVLRNVDTTCYAISYREWFNDAVSVYNQVSKALKSVSDQTILEHCQLASGIYRTTYHNGTKIYVNYNNAKADVDGLTINGHSYYIAEGGENA